MRVLFLTLPAIIALAACAPQSPSGPTVSYGDDMLPSPEVTAFERTDARLGYADAQIGRDANGCATYSATGPNNVPYSELLRDAAGQTICSD